MAFEWLIAGDEIVEFDVAEYMTKKAVNLSRRKSPETIIMDELWRKCSGRSLIVLSNPMKILCLGTI